MTAPRASGQHFNRDFALRAAAFTMGWVFFTGGWRRFVNVPAKHDIDSPASIANKLVEAAPGSVIEGPIHWVLNHPLVAEWAIYAMSTAEVAVGLGLIFGLFTRLAATGAALINIALMLIFGWQGYECLDEWTMAALGFAISVSVMINGTELFTLDRLLGRDDFARFFTRGVSIGLTLASVVFTVGFYTYYFGFFELQKRTNDKSYHVSAQSLANQPNEARLYVDSGPSAKSAYVTSIAFTMKDGSTKVVPASKIAVVRSLYEPWAQNAGSMVDGLMKLRLGAMVDIRLPAGATSAVIHLVDNEDSAVTF